MTTSSTYNTHIFSQYVCFCSIRICYRKCYILYRTIKSSCQQAWIKIQLKLDPARYFRRQYGSVQQRKIYQRENKIIAEYTSEYRCERTRNGRTAKHIRNKGNKGRSCIMVQNALTGNKSITVGSGGTPASASGLAVLCISGDKFCDAVRHQ